MNGSVVEESGIIRWLDSSGSTHRDDGPAVIYPDGTQFWYQHGRLHRTSGEPTIIAPSGVTYWHYLGARHRIGGPAVIWEDGSCDWYLNGEHYTDTEHYRRNAGVSKEEMLMLVLTYGEVRDSEHFG